MKRHRKQLEMPRVSEMSGDDVQARERGGHSVEADRPCVVEPDALTAWLPGSDATGTGVEQHRQPELLAALIQWPVLLIVRRERLQ